MQVVDNQQCSFAKEKQVFTLLKIEHLQICQGTEAVKHNHLFATGSVCIIENFPDSFRGVPYSL